MAFYWATKDAVAGALAQTIWRVGSASLAAGAGKTIAIILIAVYA
jgi:hypothetical protein